MSCVCGHAEFLHSDKGCMKFFLGCNCVTYEADDGLPTPGSCCSPDHRSDPYEGIYQSNGKYTI